MRSPGFPSFFPSMMRSQNAQHFNGEIKYAKDKPTPPPPPLLPRVRVLELYSTAPQRAPAGACDVPTDPPTHMGCPGVPMLVPPPVAPLVVANPRHWLDVVHPVVVNDFVSAH